MEANHLLIFLKKFHQLALDPSISSVISASFVLVSTSDHTELQALLSRATKLILPFPRPTPSIYSIFFFLSFVCVIFYFILYPNDHGQNHTTRADFFFCAVSDFHFKAKFNSHEPYMKSGLGCAVKAAASVAKGITE